MQALEKLVGHNDVLAYLTMMTVRLVELKRVLKKTGSIYLHCDPTASHYLKLVMDAIFGKQNFRNEIVWAYTGPSGAKRDFPRKHDIIFRYSKSDQCSFYPDEIRIPYSESFLKRRAYSEGKAGIFKEKGEHIIEEEFSKGKLPADWWDDIPSGGQISSSERLGYATQKPEALLERIIKASSKEGDWVLDPFCGCGTTVSVAERLDRKWVGIDITTLAINLIKHRLQKQFYDKNIKIFVDGLPKDLSGAKALFKKDPFEFEYWALDLVNAMPAQSKTKENMRGADRGIDGIITFAKDLKKGGDYEYGKILVQVKGGNVQRNDIATLKGDIEREKADGGLFITLEKPTQPMKQEAIEAGDFSVSFSPKKFPKIQIITIEELLKGAQPDIPFWSQPYYKEAKRVEIDNSKNQQTLLK